MGVSARLTLFLLLSHTQVPHSVAPISGKGPDRKKLQLSTSSSVAALETNSGKAPEQWGWLTQQLCLSCEKRELGDCGMGTNKNPND